jgi:hypothetical protein
MWFRPKNDRACRAMEGRLEEYLEQREADPSAKPAFEVAEHLAGCDPCRLTIQDARELNALVRAGREPLPESVALDPFFAARVGARLREQARRSGDFWPQLETVSLRLMAAGLSVAVLLGAMAAWGVPRGPRTVAARLRPADVHAISPELNPAPASPDDVVVALWSTERGRQQR